MKIVIDSREQAPFLFSGLDCETVRGSLPTGDYSLVGLESHIAIERKSLADLVGSLTSGRERFTRELERGRGMSVFAVVVESDWANLASGNYRSRMTPESATASVLALSMRNRVPFHFCSSRLEAEQITFNLLRLYLQSTQQKLKTLIKAHGEACTA